MGSAQTLVLEQPWGLIPITDRTDRNFQQPRNGGGKERRPKPSCCLSSHLLPGRVGTMAPARCSLSCLPVPTPGCSNTKKELKVVIFAIRNPIP